VTGRTVLLTVPMPLNLANSRLHWEKKRRLRNAWEVRAIAQERGLRGRHRTMGRATLAAVMYVSMRMDDDNAVARLKWVCDLLKKRGLIVDDRRPYLTLTGIPEQRTGSRPPRIELTLTEVVTP